MVRHSQPSTRRGGIIRRRCRTCPERAPPAESSTGLILDTSVLIANERGKLDLPGFLRQAQANPPAIAAITAAELLHGVERAMETSCRLRRQQYVEQILADILVLPFDLPEARCRARVWAELTSLGMNIGPHDLQIAATGLAHGHSVASINVREFKRVHGLTVIDATPFWNP